MPRCGDREQEAPELTRADTTGSRLAQRSRERSAGQDARHCLTNSQPSNVALHLGTQEGGGWLNRHPHFLSLPSPPGQLPPLARGFVTEAIGRST
jgi:hypothetical protein